MLGDFGPAAKAVGCSGECGFAPRGIGWQCVDGAACGQYLHPGDPGFAEVNDYYRPRGERRVMGERVEEVLRPCPRSRAEALAKWNRRTEGDE